MTTGQCMRPISRTALAAVKPELQARARQARCHEPYAHRNRHEAAIETQHGDRTVRVLIRWAKPTIKRPTR